MGASPPSPLAGLVPAFVASPLVGADDLGSATDRLMPARKDGAAADAAAQNGCSRPPMGGGGRLAAPVRPLRRTLCFLRSLGRSDEHAREKRPRLPGRPARRVGPLHAEQRHFSGYSFGAKRVPLRSLFVIAPSGALLSFEDGVREDKRYPNAVSMISCEAKETLTASTASPKAQRLPSPQAQHPPSPAHGGRRANGSAREAVKANALLFAFARTE